MKSVCLLPLAFLFVCIELMAQPPLSVKDWLIHPVTTKATVQQQGKYLELTNGLLKRVFYMGPNLACIDYTNLSAGQQLLRSVEPEAKITINQQAYAIGGLRGQKEKAYFVKGSETELTAGPTDFIFRDYTVTALKPFINWKPGTWLTNAHQPTGKEIQFTFVSALPALQGISIVVHYVLYDGIPLVAKWVSVHNQSTNTIVVNRVVNEVLGLVEEESAVVGAPEQMKKQHGIYVETNYAFNNAMRYDISDQTTHWQTDSTYTSQVNYNYQTPCLLEVYPERVTGVSLTPAEAFTSVRTHELLMDSYDRQRRGMMIRKMYRTIAPWTTLNPIFMHLVSKNEEEVKRAIDQCAATGYEAVILSFGSHLNMEDTSRNNILRWKALADYAREKKYCWEGILYSAVAVSAMKMM